MSNDEYKSSLIIDESCMYKVKVEDIEDLDTSYFKDAYITAFNALNEIIGENEKFNGNKYSLNCNLDFEQVNNNIISFVGERGSGKTSAMKSFVKMIRSLTTGSVNDKTKEIIKIRMDRNFYITDLIDPSMFSKNDSITEIIVAELFKTFKLSLNDNIEMSDRQQLLKCFEKVFNDLRVLNKEKSKIFEDNFDNIDILLNLSSAIALRNNLYELINKFLKMKSCDFVIIQIDDLDMNISAGAKMLEDLRKYLNLPNVIIVMAAKYPQLFEVVKQENINYMDALYKYTKDIEGEREAFTEEINNKTEKYMEKLIPVSRRIYLPEVIINNTNISIRLDNDIDDQTDKPKDEEEVSVSIRRLLYEKLRIVIVTDKAAGSIIPKNLRSFIQFVKLLYDLQDVSDSAEKKYKAYNEIINKAVKLNEDALLSNIEKFKNIISEGYIFNTATISLHDISKLLYCKIEQLNRLVLEYLNGEIIRSVSKYDKEIEWYGKYVEYVNKNRIFLKQQNISYGDVITWLAIYEGLNIQDKERNTIEFVKLIYSVRLLEALWKDDFTIDKINGHDFIGNYFEIKNTVYARTTKSFKEQVEFINNNEFNINLNKERYEKIVQLFNETEIDVIGQVRKIRKTDVDLVNVSLEKLIDKYNSYYLEISKQNKRIEEDDILNEFNILFNHIYYFYNTLEPRDKEKSDLNRFMKDEIYYNIYVRKNSYVSARKNYFFRAFNIITSHLFREDMYEKFLENMEIRDKRLNDNSDIRFDFKKYLLNVDFFMNILDDSINYFNKKRPYESYDSRLNYWLDTNIPDILNNIEEKAAQYESLIGEKRNNKIQIMTDDLKEIMDGRDRIIPFILENIVFNNPEHVGILGNTNEKIDINKENIIELLQFIDKLKNYVIQKVNEDIKGTSISNQLLKDLNKMKDLAGVNSQFIKKYYSDLDVIRKDFNKTVKDSNDRKELLKNLHKNWMS